MPQAVIIKSSILKSMFYITKRWNDIDLCSTFGGYLELSDLKLLLQRHFTDGLVTVVGSGLSCAEGLPGMGALAAYLQAHIEAGLSDGDKVLWAELSPMISANGLEAALLENPPSASLEAAIVAKTAELIAQKEREIVTEVFNKTRTLRFTRLLTHMLKPTAGIPVITTNYDRLIEIASEEACLGVDTLFVGQFAAHLNEQESRLGFCREVTLKGKTVQYRYRDRVNVFKPHGSLDWYYREGKPVSYAGDLPLHRLIITPGLNKFRNGYESLLTAIGNEQMVRSTRPTAFSSLVMASTTIISKRI
jgi:hypothetical protein